MNKEYNFKYLLNEELADIINRLKQEYAYFKDQEVKVKNNILLNKKLFNKKIIIGDNMLNLNKNSKYIDIMQKYNLNWNINNFNKLTNDSEVEIIEDYLRLNELRKNYLLRFSKKNNLSCSYADLFKYKFINNGDRLIIKNKLFKVYKDNLITTIDEKYKFTYNEACQNIYNNNMNSWNTVKLIVSTKKVNLINNLIHSESKYSDEERKIKLIQKIIANVYSTSINNILDRSKYNLSDIEARQIGMYLSRKLTKNTLSTISKMFNRQYHTTVMSAIKKVKNKNEISNDFKNKIYQIENRINKEFIKKNFYIKAKKDINSKLERR